MVTWRPQTKKKLRVDPGWCFKNISTPGKMGLIWFGAWWSTGIFEELAGQNYHHGCIFPDYGFSTAVCQVA